MDIRYLHRDNSDYPVSLLCIPVFLIFLKGNVKALACSCIAIEACSMEEAIHGSLKYDSQNTPTASYHKSTENKAEEKRDSLPIGLQPTESEQEDLDRPTHQEREPEYPHRPTPGNGKTCRMKRPPDELHTHDHQYQCG